MDSLRSISKHFGFLKLLFLILLAVISSSSIISQRIWERLDNIHYFQPEDIVITLSGKIYIAVLGRNIILESSDQGRTWRNIIINDTLKYNSFNTQKELFVDYRDSLIEFLHTFGFLIPSYYDGITFHLDTLIYKNLNAWKGVNGIVKYDQNGNYFFIENNSELKKYSVRWFESKKIFDNGNKIRNYYVYTDTINYIVSDLNNSYEIFKFNSVNGKSRLLTFQPPVSYAEDILVTKNGRVLIPTYRGLYLSFDEGKNYKLITFDSLVNPRTAINSLQFTLKGEILMNVDQGYYYTVDEGEHWHKLGAFNIGFPEYQKIEKLEVLDTQLAVLIINDKCDLKKAYLLSTTKGWLSIDAGISILDMGYIYKDRSERLYARDHLCNVVYSDDESKTWNSYFIDSKNLKFIIPTKTGSLFAITEEEKLLYSSIDNGNNWKYISDVDLGIPSIEILGVNPLFDYTLLIEGGIRDQGSATYKEYFYLITHDNGNSWRLLPKETYQFIQTIAWDGKGKLYSYAFKKKEVYSSIDFGQSWNIDHTFDDFNEIFQISFNNNGGIILQGINHGIQNVYISIDGVNFIPAKGDLFKKNYVGFIDINYPYIAAIANEKGVYLSSDGGVNWEDITSGITILDSVITFINSIYVDEKNHAYLSIQYDGLYKSINPLVSLDDHLNNNKAVVLYPNPFKDNLIVKCPACINSSAYIEIYNSLGILIRNQLIDKEFTQLKFNQEYSSGLYTYKLIQSGLVYDTGKILKSNN